MSKRTKSLEAGAPKFPGLYRPEYEKDACGIGFVADIHGRQSHQIVRDAIGVLARLEHRGGCGCEENTGDGAGLLGQKPHEFFRVVSRELDFEIPEDSLAYGVGLIYMPPSVADQVLYRREFERIVQEEGQSLLGWRLIPTHPEILGKTALEAKPDLLQVFIRRNDSLSDDLDFERKLYVIRKRVALETRRAQLPNRHLFYISSLSYKTLVYKGMLTAPQLGEFFDDLNHEAFESAIALVHSRFSTNTTPNWQRAHPYRYIVHNGEINTLQGNVNWMNARQAHFASNQFKEDLQKVLPVIDPHGSDSAMFDNTLEFLVLAGRPLEETLMMMIPQPWSKHENMDPKLRAFYRFYHSIMEPWDGPSSIAFTDGKKVGAILDRNGLRPSRYVVTKDGRVIMSSEVGVVDVDPSNVESKDRVRPGRMLLIDTEKGELIKDRELKEKAASARPYEIWLKDHLVSIRDLPQGTPEPELSEGERLQYQHLFGYSREDFTTILSPMARDGVEPIGAMGNDAPLAVLSERPQLLYSFFKQKFAQVTNPPIDPIREEIIMSARVRIGPERNLLDTTPGSAHQIKLYNPVMTNQELAKIYAIKRKTGFRSVTIPIHYAVDQGQEGLDRGLAKVFERAKRAIDKGANILILSDRKVDRQWAPIPALLAVSGLHHYLIREGLRANVGVVLESAEPREVHHFATLIGYGASAVNPYLALESLREVAGQGPLKHVSFEKACKNYVKAAVKGILKISSKMGISTIRSYCGAQIFEAIGLDRDLANLHFTGTPARIGGYGLPEISKSVEKRHNEAFQTSSQAPLPSAGQYQYRADGEFHLFNPDSIHKLQHAVRTKDYSIFKEYTKLIDEQSEHYATIRGLLEFDLDQRKPISIDEVEPASQIVKRFKTGAMSYGSISAEAHETLAIAMNRIQGRSNTGEGGEHPSRFTKDTNGDDRCSAIKQVASGRFGVTSHYLVNSKEIQIKIAQGAKPGEGGQLPGTKVYPWVAEVRHSTTGVGLISPPPHHDIYSIEDLAQLIHDLKSANPDARISVKLVASAGVGTIAAGVAKCRADVVLISGYDGGTGASPLTSIKNAGVPWELGLSETHQTLIQDGLRSRIAVEVDGQLKSGKDVVVGALMGAEEFGFGTAPLVTLGCIMMRVCHKNTCPVGVATQNPELRKMFTGAADHVVNFMMFIAEEVREWMAKLGFKTVEEMIGQVHLLKSNETAKKRGIDLSEILYSPEAKCGAFKTEEQDHQLERSLDQQFLIEDAKSALEGDSEFEGSYPIANTDRTVGTILGSEITKKYGSIGLPQNAITLNFRGSAGQSFGAFIPRGLTLKLEGDSNDYLGKGLSGGRLVVKPDREATFVAEENIIIGNVALYGATSGDCYIRGIAGERFAVRNSGATAVVEGVGDHGCEYMTGGRVVVLGKTGRNFAAGMSGGIAYVYNESGHFFEQCNHQMVFLEPVEEEESDELKKLVKEHYKLTESTRAKKILDNWEGEIEKFIRVHPKDYKRMVEIIQRKLADGLSEKDAQTAAFYENAQDTARVGGN